MHRELLIFIFLTLLISCGKPTKTNININKDILSQFLQAVKTTDEAEKPSQELARKHKSVQELTQAITKTFDEADRHREQVEARWRNYKKTEQEAGEKYAEIQKAAKKEMEKLQPILDSVDKQIADQEKMGREFNAELEKSRKEMEAIQNKGLLATDQTIIPVGDIREVQISELGEKARLAYSKLGSLSPDDYYQEKLEKIIGELVNIDDSLLTGKLLWDLYHPENEIFAKNAIVVLGKKKEKRAVSRLLELYKEKGHIDDYEKILPAALVEIGDLQIMPVLIENTAEEGGLLYRDAQIARAALVKMGSPVVPILLSALKEPKYPDEISGILAVLGEIKDARAIEPLVEMVKSDETKSEVRLEALKTIEVIIGTKDKFKFFLAQNSLFLVLDELINCYDDNTQYDAVHYLITLEAETYEDKILAMRKPYSDDHHWLDGIAAEYLEKYGTKKALPYLAKCFLYAPGVREKAISAYGAIIARCSGCVPTIEEFSKLENLLVQEGILIALQWVRQSDQSTAIPILLRGSESNNINIREAALATAKNYFSNRTLSRAMAKTEKKYPRKRVSEKQIKDGVLKIGEALLKEKQKEIDRSDFQKEEIAKLQKALKRKDYRAALNSDFFEYHDASMVFSYTVNEFPTEVRLAAYRILSARFTDNWDVADFIDEIRNTANDMEELPEIRGAARQTERSWNPSE